MDFEIYDSKKSIIFSKLYLDDTVRINLMKETIRQNESPFWIDERRKRLTVSHFGYVCNKLPKTRYDSIMKNILYNNLETDGMK